MTASEWIIVSGLLSDIFGFALIARYGFSRDVWAGKLDDLLGDLVSKGIARPASPEEVEEERLENKRIIRQRRIAMWGIRLVIMGFVLQLIGVAL